MPYDVNSFLEPATTKTATGNGSVYTTNTTALRGMKARLLVTAASGTTPTLTLKIQESADNSNWNDLVTFPQVTDVGETFVTVESKKKYLRTHATIGGTTPSFTYSVDLGIAAP